ncbi:MAG: hypothetical protein M3Z10_08295 [Gemmatimonadota bacterium]|nr:hypothetical protein [Gemmatimonadota bacterium]
MLHDVYVKVLGGETRFDGRSALKTRLFGIVRRTAINQRRTQRLRALLGVRNARRIDGPEPQLTVPHEIVALVAWRPATDILLVTPGNELLRSRPTLGTSLLGAMPALDTSSEGDQR